jgi:predicted transcriptional regulator
MKNSALEEIVASRARLKIAGLLSSRPRTLGELAEFTGISVQAVLKHLDRLSGIGLIEETALSKPKRLGVRKIYALKRSVVGDYSLGDLMVVNLAQEPQGVPGLATEGSPELERLAEDSLIQRERIRDRARKLGRMINELAETESKLKRTIGELPLNEEEKLVAYVMFTEDSRADAARVLGSHYACKEPQAAMEEVDRKLQSGQ